MQNTAYDFQQATEAIEDCRLPDGWRFERIDCTGSVTAPPGQPWAARERWTAAAVFAHTNGRTPRRRVSTPPGAHGAAAWALSDLARIFRSGWPGWKRPGQL